MHAQIVIWKFVLFRHRHDKNINDHGKGSFPVFFFFRLMTVQIFFPFGGFNSNMRKHFKKNARLQTTLLLPSTTNWLGENDRGIFSKDWGLIGRSVSPLTPKKHCGNVLGYRSKKNFVIKKWLNSAVKISDAPSENSPPVPTEKNSSEGFSFTRLVWKMFSLLHLVQKQIHSQPIWPLLWLQYLK